jgi:hypothetical protein
LEETMTEYLTITAAVLTAFFLRGLLHYVFFVENQRRRRKLVEQIKQHARQDSGLYVPEPGITVPHRPRRSRRHQ